MFTLCGRAMDGRPQPQRLASAAMVVELLTFRIDPADREAWLAADAAVWTAFLAGRPGFVAKQVWVDDDDPWQVEAVIWWRSQDDWDAVGPDEVATVDAAMGDLRCEPTCRTRRVAAVFPDPS